MQKIIYRQVGEATPERESIIMAILKVIFLFIILPLIFYFVFIRTPRAEAQQIQTPVSVQVMTIEQKKELLVRLIALLNQLLKQLQEVNQQKIMTENTPVNFGSTQSPVQVNITRFLVRVNRDVIIESDGEIDLNTVRFYVDQKELPTRILVVSPEKRGSIFVYTTSVDVPLYEVSGQNEGADQKGPAFALFTVSVGNRVSKEALQNKSNGYEVSVQF